MGWYFRRSVKFGPLRLNFSKSGVGYSYGVKGLRVGTGPRGPYVAGGRYGIYFRQSLKPSTTAGNNFISGTTSIPVYCTHCGASIQAGNCFCTQCGARLEETPIGQVFEPEHSVHRHPLLWVAAGFLGFAVLIGILRKDPSSIPQDDSSPTSKAPEVMPKLPEIPNFKPGTAIQHGPDRLMKLVLRDCGRPSLARQEAKIMIWEYPRKGYNLSWALPITKEDRTGHEGGPWLMTVNSRKDGTFRPVNDPRAYERQMPCIRTAVFAENR